LGKTVTYLPRSGIFWDTSFAVAVLCPVANVSMKLLIAASGPLLHFSMSPSSRNLPSSPALASVLRFILPLPHSGKPRRRNSCPSFGFVQVRWEKATILSRTCQCWLGILSPSNPSISRSILSHVRFGTCGNLTRLTHLLKI
jgi:hypothetical protein